MCLTFLFEGKLVMENICELLPNGGITSLLLFAMSSSSRLNVQQIGHSFMHTVQCVIHILYRTGDVPMYYLLRAYMLCLVMLVLLLVCGARSSYHF